MIRVDIRRGLWVQTHPKGMVKAQFGRVYLSFGRNRVEFTTPAAHKVGFALIRKSEEARRDSAFVVLIVNRVEVNLLPRDAKRIGANLLLQSEKADDFQRKLA